MIVLYQGELEVQGSETKTAPHAIAFQLSGGSEEDIQIRTIAPNTRFILLAGKPLNEPIANYGPFVLTTQE